MDEHTEKVKAYIFDQLRAGFTPDEIAGQLKAANWPEQYIKDGFHAAQAAMVPTAAPEVTAPVTGHAAHTPPQATTVKRGRIRTGWRLFKQSLSIMRKHPSLFRYVVMTLVVSFLAIIAVLGAFLISVALAAGAGAAKLDHASANTLTWVLAFVLYVVLFYIANVYAAGLTANVLDIFKGQHKPYGEYMRLARSKAGALLLYAVIEATVGLLLRFIIERVRFVGWIIARLLGAAWSLGTLFVVPIIVTSDKPNGAAAVKQSMGLFRRTWGESIVSKASIGVTVFLIYLGLWVGGVVVFMLAAFGAGSAFGNNGAAVVAIIFGIIWAASFIALAFFSALANSIINIALFYYATYHQVPPAFDASLLNSVFISRKRRLFGKKNA